MPRNSSGVYTLPDGYLASTGQTILASQHNPPLEDLAGAITGSLPRNGTAGMVANLSMGNFKVTNLADGTAATDAATKGQLDAVTTGTVTETGVQPLTNKTISASTIILKSSSPDPTADGDIRWDAAADAIVIGDGSTQKIFVPLPASVVAGDVFYASGARALARLAKGTASQVVQMNAGATAPQWTTLPFTKSFESAATAFSNGSSFNIAHGLGTTPKLYLAVIQCAATDGTTNYLVGDEIVIPNNTDASNVRGIALVPDATNLHAAIGGSGIRVLSKDGGNMSNITAANWRLIVRAWA